MTDAPLPPPRSRADTAIRFVGELARPVSIVATSLSAAITPIVVASRAAPDQLDLTAAGIFVGAIYGGVAALYWGKAWEVARTGKSAAEVEIARVTTVSPTEPDAGR